MGSSMTVRIPDDGLIRPKHVAGIKIELKLSIFVVLTVNLIPICNLSVTLPKQFTKEVRLSNRGIIGTRVRGGGGEGAE
jgi:hypothetical protein